MSLQEVLITAFLFASDCKISWFLARYINLPFYGQLLQDGFFYNTVMDHLNGSFAYAGLPLDHDIFIFLNTFGFVVNAGFGNSIGIVSKTNAELNVNIYFMWRGIKIQAWRGYFIVLFSFSILGQHWFNLFCFCGCIKHRYCQACSSTKLFNDPCDMNAFFILRTLLCVFVFAWTVLHCLSDV